MKTLTKEGRETNLKDDLFDSFKLRLKGPLLLPGDTGYEDSRTVWNAMIDKKPAFVVKCLGTADVIECVNFANQNDILLCIKGGGHNIAGLAAADGAMMLDMSLMRGVWVDKERKIAHAQAGCLLGDVDRETQLHGLAAVLGFISQTGIAGLTLGGGFGYLTRKYGWTADNLEGMNIVTADGKLVRASNNENADLFWGLRGGGGNFGVLTAIDYKLYPVGPEVVGGLVAWPISEAGKVLELFRTFAENAPPELTLVSVIRPAPPAPWLPGEWHGKMIAALLACYTGNQDEGEKILAAIKSFGKPIGDVLIRRPYVQLQSLLDATQPKGRHNYWKSEYLSKIEPELCDNIIKHAQNVPSPHSVLTLFQIGGALNKLGDDHSPAGNRNAKYVFNAIGSWEKTSSDEVNVEWVRSAWNDVKKFSTGGVYLNFLSEDEGQERVDAALGGAIKRLGEIKKKWDPENMFRTNRNIKPA
jgi:FAD/FMN-containing dehydrogenase